MVVREIGVGGRDVRTAPRNPTWFMGFGVRVFFALPLLFLSFFVFAAAAQDDIQLTSPLILSESTSARFSGPGAFAAETDGAGVWLIAWSSSEEVREGIGTDRDILCSRSTNGGESWSSPKALNPNAFSDRSADSAPSLATDGQGSWIAVWESDDDLGGLIGGDADILVSRSGDNGVSWSAPQVLNGNAARDGNLEDRWPRVVYGGNGTWLVVWNASYMAPANSTEESYAYHRIARSADGGLTWSEKNAIRSGRGIMEPVELAANGSGIWLMAWHDAAQGRGGDRDIYCARSLDDGNTWAEPMPLNDNALSDSGADDYPSLSTDGEGVWIAAWRSDLREEPSDDPRVAIVFSRSLDDGASWSSPETLSAGWRGDSDSFEPGFPIFPSVSPVGNGTWAAVWKKTYGSVISNRDTLLYALSHDDGVTWGDGKALIPNEHAGMGTEYAPLLRRDASGAWVAVWRVSPSRESSALVVARGRESSGLNFSFDLTSYVVIGGGAVGALVVGMGLTVFVLTIVQRRKMRKQFADMMAEMDQPETSASNAQGDDQSAVGMLDQAPPPAASGRIEMSCPHCGHQLRIPEKFAGQRGKCKHCQEEVMVPAPAFSPAEAEYQTVKSQWEAPDTGADYLTEAGGQPVPVANRHSRRDVLIFGVWMLLLLFALVSFPLGLYFAYVQFVATDELVGQTWRFELPDNAETRDAFGPVGANSLTVHFPVRGEAVVSPEGESQVTGKYELDDTSVTLRVDGHTINGAYSNGQLSLERVKGARVVSSNDASDP